MKSTNISLKVLKIITIVAPGIFLGIFELTRHFLFVETYPMVVGNLVVLIAALIAAFIFSRFIFRIMERMQGEIVRKNQELAALNSVAAAVSESLSLDVVLYRALDRVLQVTGADAGELFLLDQTTQELVLRAQTGPCAKAFREKTRFRLGEGLIGSVAQSGEPSVVKDPSKDPRILRGGLRESGFRCLACMPLKLKDTVIGVFDIATLSNRCFCDDDLRLLVSMGNQIALAIENARLHEKVQSAATIEERERIAREMHDSLAQVLSYINIKTQAVRSFLAKGNLDQAQSHLSELEESARGLYTEVREAILGLRVAAPLQQGLVPALKEYVFRFSQLSNLKAELNINEDRLAPLSLATEVQVIRIIQEALTNVRKLARAS
ncbi:MAG: GAF domain-containing protein, partial [Chloroflexi bacterium]|nr:GAF domain-containing protein [Chloroflexota bacterium]